MSLLAKCRVFFVEIKCLIEFEEVSKMLLFVLTIGLAVLQFSLNIIVWKIIFRKEDGADKKDDVAPLR